MRILYGKQSLIIRSMSSHIGEWVKRKRQFFEFYYIHCLSEGIAARKIKISLMAHK